MILLFQMIKERSFFQYHCLHKLNIFDVIFSRWVQNQFTDIAGGLGSVYDYEYIVIFYWILYKIWISEMGMH